MTVPVTTRRTTLLFCACAAALALTGCDSSGADAASTATTGGSASAYVPGPLDEYMARIYGYSFDESDQQTQDEAEAEYSRQTRQIEELIAQCMSEEGFDYTPDTSSSTVVSADDLDVEMGTVEFAEQYGYGISTDPWGMEGETTDDSETWTDPNQEYLDAMSDSELAAYELALYGPGMLTESQDEDYEEYDWTTAGCMGAAQHQVYETDADTEAGDFTALEDAMNDRWEQVSTSTEMMALEGEWASCMTDQGLSGLSTVTAATDDLYTQWYSLNGWDAEEVTDVTEPVAADLTAFTEKEIEQAVADLRCQEETDYQARSTAIDHADQQAFVDLHREELEAWAEAATTARGE